MGAIIGMSAAIYQPQRYASFVLGGASPYAGQLTLAGTPFEELWTRFSHLPGADHDAWAACVEETNRFGGAVQALKTTRVPVLLFAGDQDSAPFEGAKRFSEEHGKPFFAVEGRNHAETFADAETVIPRVTEFLKQHPID
jgi:pimeloyl-ACP methyl ester carboxylesterase